jgi:hypothetical protein
MLGYMADATLGATGEQTALKRSTGAVAKVLDFATAAQTIAL